VHILCGLQSGCNSFSLQLSDKPIQGRKSCNLVRRPLPSRTLSSYSSLCASFLGIALLHLAHQKADKPVALEYAVRIALFRNMLYVRRVEERIVALYREQEMRCPTHFSIGQEAIAAGVSLHLRRDDHTISAHRSHAHYLCKGGSLKAMLAELYGKAAGCARGKGGSMHLIDLSVNFLGCVPIVGSTIPIGVGAAFGSALQDQRHVTVIYFGDAAAETGVFYEAMNWAVLQNLPVLFVCENNQYCVRTPLSLRQPEKRTIREVAEAIGVLALGGHGHLVEEVYSLAGEAIEQSRAGKGPTLIEFQTYRWLEHCGPLYDLDQGYRPAGEFEFWSARCPVKLQQECLIADGLMNESAIEIMTRDIDSTIDQAVAFAKQAPFPKPDALFADVYA
jgi:TPP-dependent pyruvate/acetoin dehydrogenase alpha subunit